MSQPLSPAAQAVFNAAWTCPIVLGDHPATRTRQLAAALRAAADQLFKTDILPPGYAYSVPAEAWHYEFRLDAHRKLRSIAAELEGTSPTNQED